MIQEVASIIRTKPLDVDTVVAVPIHLLSAIINLMR